MQRRAAVPLLFLVSVAIGLLATVALSAFAGQQVAPRFSGGACPSVVGAHPAEGFSDPYKVLRNPSEAAVAAAKAELSQKAVAECGWQLAKGMQAARARCLEQVSHCDAFPGCSYELLTPVYDQCAPAECTTSTAESDTGDVSVIVRCTSKGAGAAYCSCGGGFSEIPPEYGGPQPGGAAPAGPATGSDTCNFAAPGELASLVNAYLDTPTAPDGSDLFETVLSQACANKVCADPGPHFGQECEYVAGGTDLAKRCRCPGGSCAPADPSCPGGEPPAGSVTGQEPEVAGGAAEGEEEVVAGTQPDAGVVAG